MAPQRPVLLLTGFGPFPTMPENLTSTFVPQLAQAATQRWPTHNVVHEIFATEWGAAPNRLAELYADLQPEIALHFGVSERAKGFVIETLAVNTCTRAPDAAGCLPLASTLDAFGSPEAATLLPADAILARLDALNIPASLSNDAGQYLCNAVFYRALQLATSDVERAPVVGFVHMPARFHEVASERLTPHAALSGGLEIISECLKVCVQKRIAV